MNRSLLVCVALSCLLPACSTASPRDGTDDAPRRATALGAELQAYPAGIIPGIHAQFPTNEHGSVTARLAANITDRQDFGEHDDETGEGFGGGVGYRHHFGENGTGWLLGARVDLWFLEIDWEDAGGARTGTTDVDTSGEDVGEGAIFLVGLTWWM